jgi:hypothetical protein
MLSFSIFQNIFVVLKMIAIKGLVSQLKICTLIIQTCWNEECVYVVPMVPLRACVKRGKVLSAIESERKWKRVNVRECDQRKNGF